jgi:hypothetical protein
MIRRFIAAVMIAAGLLAGGAGTAFADPDFGPGNSDKGPHDPGAICHLRVQSLPNRQNPAGQGLDS